MPDYASILSRSISALPDQSPAMREAVYARARAALARQLTAVDPPLSSREIENQHRELEDAVAQLEADFAPPEPEPPPAQPEPDRDDEFFYAAPHKSASLPLRKGDDEDDRALDSGPAAPVSDVDNAEDDDQEAEDDEEYEDAGSRLPLIVGGVLLALVIAGLAYAYFQRDSLLAMFGFGGTEEVATEVPVLPEQPAAVEPPADIAAAGQSDKMPDRMTNGVGQPEVAPPPDDLVLAEPDGAEGTPLDALPGELPAADDGAIVEEQPTEVAVAEPPSENLVAQRAIYYFQGGEGSRGQQAEGSAQWQEISRDGQPAVEAILRLPEQNVTVTITITRNADSSLPASHLVEVMFAGALGPSPIQRVPALVLKQTEQARGEPLTGAAVMVTEDLFWIALSDEAEQVDRNLQLLQDGSWFDIPILFDDGTRALLTFEKGIPGDKVFETVLAAWQPG